MMFHPLRDAFLKAIQMDREIDVRLREMAQREYVPFITRSQNTTNDEDVITSGAARDLKDWFQR